MDTLALVPLQYIVPLWLVLGTVTFVSCLVFVLKDDDDALRSERAILLSLVGLASLVYPTQAQGVSPLLADFRLRWRMLGGGSFRSFALAIALFAYALAPFAFLIVFSVRCWDHLVAKEFMIRLRNGRRGTA
jgi:hypothetical protein